MSLNALGYSNVNLGSDVSLIMPESMKHQGLAYPALPNCKSRVVSVPCTNATSATSGQNLIISLPNQGVYKKQSGYLKFRVKTATHAAKFKNNAGVSALFNRITITSGGVCEVLQNYDYYAGIILNTLTNKNYFQSDAYILEGTHERAITTTDTEFCMPILSNILGNQKSFPLFLLAQPLQIELQLNSLTRALYASVDGSLPTDFTISDIRFVYENIYAGSDYENAVRAHVQQNGAYSFNFDTYIGHQVAVTNGAALSFNGGIGKQSVEAILAVNVVAAELTEAKHTSLGVMSRMTANADEDLGLSCFVDGQSVLPQPINRNSQVLIEGQRSCNSCFDTVATLAGDAASYGLATPITGGCMVAGFNTRVFDEQNLVSGIPVSNFQLVRNAVYNAGGVVFIYCIHKANLRIDASGMTSLQS
jgi:hypothetical protein